MNAHARVIELLGEMRALAPFPAGREFIPARKRYEELSDGLEVLTRAFMEPVLDEGWAQYGLTKKERRIAALLHKRLGHCVSREAIQDALYFDVVAADDEPDGVDKILDVFFCKMKPKLLSSPYSVENVRGEGLKMVLRTAVSPQSWTRYGLTAREGTIATALQAKGGEYLSIGELLDMIYPDGRKPAKNLHIFIFRARQKLKKSPFDIRFDRGLGYRMIYKPSALALTALQELQAH